MWHSSCMSETWGSDFDYFMKIYSLMPFDAFNSSLVEHCLIYVAGLELVTHSHIQGTRRAKSPNTCALEVTDLIGDKHQFDQCHPARLLGGWPSTSARVTRYTSVCCRVTRPLWTGDPRVNHFSWKMVIWRQRLWETRHISINKSFMCRDQENEPHQVLNWIKCFVWEIQNISSTI
jgi:hypothetical protein